MRGLEIPELTEDFTADPVELFFDLAYVFAFSQLVGRLVEDPSWSGVGETALLFLLLWLPWSQFTWSANTVSGNGRPIRLLFLLATAASIPMAASVSTAFESGGPVFALSMTVIMVMGLATLRLVEDLDASVSQSVVRWMGPNLLAMSVLIAGAFLDGGARVGLWIAVVLIVIGAMALAGRGDWIVRSGHFAERHGLIVIIALGEVIVAIGIPVVASLEGGQGLPAGTVIALLAAGAFAGAFWWSYFDRVGPAIENRAGTLEGLELSRFVRDVYTGAHAAIVAGVILAAAALEEIALHPTDEVPIAFRLMLVGGLLLFTAGVAIAVWRAFRVVPRERIVGAAAITVIALVGGSLEGTIVLVGIVAIVIVTLLSENRRVEG